MSVEGINFKGVVLNDWNNYGNELLRIAFSVLKSLKYRIFEPRKMRRYATWSLREI
jgi:hypothetical protein